MKRAIYRRKEGRRFRYYIDDQPLTDKQQIEYINSLRIPPAWRDVSISPSRQAKIQATGYDKAGRLQYIYSPVFRARQERAKFDKILRFAEALPRLRRTTSLHLDEPGLGKRKVLAAIVKLIDKAYFRVGNEVYARQNQSYGITTMRSKHTTVKGDSVIFDFRGKSGQDHHKTVTNRKIARIVKRLDELPGYEVFKYIDESGISHTISSQDVNEYIKDIMGEEFSAKDFRTWGATVLAAAELASTERPPNVRERKKTVTACIKNVALKLGNTPAITRGSYIDPRIIKIYLGSNELAQVRRAMEKTGRLAQLTADESCLLAVMERAK